MVSLLTLSEPTLLPPFTSSFRDESSKTSPSLHTSFFPTPHQHITFLIRPSLLILRRPNAVMVSGGSERERSRSRVQEKEAAKERRKRRTTRSSSDARPEPLSGDSCRRSDRNRRSLLRNLFIHKRREKSRDRTLIP